MPPACPSRCRTYTLLTRRGARRRSDVVRGFTLIELLAVIAVIAILAAFAVGAIRGARERTNIARARGELATLATALEEFKRRYGDYPQTGEFTQATATPTLVTTGPGVQTAQAKLFNALTGVFGARGFTNSDRLNGPNLLDVGKFSLNGNLTNQFLVPVTNAPNPPAKLEQNVCLLDPWGRRYLYYYRNARNPGQWQAPGYVLFSAGNTVAANGTQTPPITVTTGLMLTTQSAEMADNIYANP
jgi:prepilin-type N-terminal cleavage/methylation domain-containing protein